MSAFNRTPQNTNLLQATKFLMTFDRMPSTSYFCQSVTLPGISVGQAPIAMPGIVAFAPGNQIAYNNFNIVFTIDEAMASWREIHKWFLSFASPNGTDERNKLTTQQNQYKMTGSKSFEQYSDGTLTVLNALNNPVVRVQFYNMFPVSLSDINFDTKQSADDIITGDATFVFQSYEFI
jgi:hypothetical protein